MKQTTPAELRLVQLGIDVVVIEQEALAAEQLEEAADQENVVGRVAGMDRVKAVPPQHAAGEHELPEQR